jgi:hypothetical protein
MAMAGTHTSDHQAQVILFGDHLRAGLQDWLESQIIDIIMLEEGYPPATGGGMANSSPSDSSVSRPFRDSMFFLFFIRIT